MATKWKLCTFLLSLLAVALCDFPAYYKSICYDGSRVIDSQYCPNRNSGCPFFLPYRCSNGSCASSYRSCDKPVCGENEFVCNDGSCHSTEDDCTNLNAFGCPGTKIRCVNGQCLSSCYEVDNTCNSGTKCPSGQCAVSGNGENCIILPQELYDYCDSLGENYGSDSNLRLKPCADGTCVHVASECPVLNLDSEKSLKPCGYKSYRNTTDFCPSDCPAGLTRCSNGLCTKGNCAFQRTISVLSTVRSSDCSAGETRCLTSCTSRNCSRVYSESMYVCPDGSYARTTFAPLGDAGSFPACRPTVKCSYSLPYLCDNITCVTDSGSCPPMVCSGYRCTSGRCVGNYYTDCGLEDYICPEDIPVLCSTGYCVRSPQECPDTTSTLVNSQSACSPSTPYHCSDGSCVSDPSLCLAVVSACDPRTLPYRCRNGLCAANSLACASSTVTCAYGQTLCSDGTCQYACTEINGCPIDRPYQCPNGVCGLSLSECAARGGCPMSKPYQCYDMSCAENAPACLSPVWMLKPRNLLITIHNTTSATYEVCESVLQYVCVKVSLPSGTRLCNGNGDSCYSAIVIRPVADSVLRKLWLNVDADTENFVRENVHAGYGDVDGMTLVKSPAINVSGVGGGYLFTSPIRIELFTRANLTADYCIGLANVPARSWTCVQRVNYTTGYSSRFWIQTAGVYAIIYYPTYAETVETVKCRWPCNYPRWYVLSVLGCALLATFIVLSLWGVSVTKSRARHTRQKVSEFQRRLELASTGAAGRSIKSFSVGGSRLVKEGTPEEELKEPVVRRKLQFEGANQGEQPPEEKQEYQRLRASSEDKEAAVGKAEQKVEA